MVKFVTPDMLEAVSEELDNSMDVFQRMGADGSSFLDWTEQHDVTGGHINTLEDMLKQYRKQGLSHYKAVIQTSRTNGEHRVFFLEDGVVYRKIHPDGIAKRVGYTGLTQLAKGLKNTVTVGWDEQVLWDGVPCDHCLTAQRG